MCLISYSPKPHLRQVFVRVCRLCREGVSLIVVLDGEAVQLKWAAMDTRAQAVGGGAGRQRTTGRRTNLNRLVKEVTRLVLTQRTRDPPLQFLAYKILKSQDFREILQRFHEILQRFHEIEPSSPNWVSNVTWLVIARDYRLQKIKSTFGFRMITASSWHGK